MTSVWNDTWFTQHWTHFGMVAYRLERSACNTESTSSSVVVRDRYVGILSKFLAHDCSAIDLVSSA